MKKSLMVFGIVFLMGVFLIGNVYASLDFSQATKLTWPPSNQSDSCYGAECNPTGDPIGGFVDYSRIVNSSDADFYVNNKSGFLSAIENVASGEIIYINDSVTLDFTNYETIEINISNITIASGRGNNYSQGALIKKDIMNHSGSSGDYLIYVFSENVRITGLRFYGGDIDCNSEYHSAIFYQERSDLENKYYSIYKTNTGIRSNASNFEIDNCELYGWRTSAIYSLAGALDNYVHHNYIHHNCHAGLGYGVSLGTGNNITFLIEANLFDNNRHSIASTGDITSYEARYNIQLDKTISHSFDRHPAGSYDGNNASGGNYTIIHHNSFYVEKGICSQSKYAVGIRAPPVVANGSQIYNNWFSCIGSLNDLIFTNYPNGSRSDVYGAPGTNVSAYKNLQSLTHPSFVFPNAIAVSNASVVSVGESIFFDGSQSSKRGGSIRYIEWDFADNSSLKYGNSTVHSFSYPGTYEVRMSVSDDIGSSSHDYLKIVVMPSNVVKTYLDFWMFENSRVDSPEYVQKQAKVNGEIVWQQNFSDNFSGWRHISIDIPSNLSDDVEGITLELGVTTLKNYTDPLYPNTHEIEFFDVSFDQISILKWGDDLLGRAGYFDSGGDFWEAKTNYSSWVNEISWKRRINGDYGYRIAPVFRGNYTKGNFVGISRYVALSNYLFSDNNPSNLFNQNVSRKNGISHLSISDDSLKLYLPFDSAENSLNYTFDYTNNLKNGLVFGGAHFSSTGGAHGGSYDFDGVDDYIDIHDAYGLSNNITICSFAKATSIPDDHDIVVGGGGYRLGLSTFSNKWGFLTHNYTGYNNVVSEEDIEIGKYYGLCGVLLSNGSKYLYIDGELNASGVMINSEIPTVNWRVGSDTNPGRFFNGSIDEVMIFDRALNSSEIRIWHDNQSSKFYGTGEMNFSGLTISADNFVNITISECETPGNSHLQIKIDSGHWKNFTACSILNYPVSGNLVNSDLTIKFVSDDYGFYTPLIKGNILLQADSQVVLPIGDSSSSGGSSSSKRVIIILENSENSLEFRVDKSSIIEFNFKNKTGFLYVQNVFGENVYFSLEGNSYVAYENSFVEIDLDDDGKNDIKVYVENIVSSFADLRIELINYGENPDENSEDIFVKKNKWVFWAVGILIFLIGIYFVYRRHGKNLNSKKWFKG